MSLQTTSTLDTLYQWLSGLPSWQQDLARRLIDITELPGAEVDEAIRLALREQESSEAPSAGPRAHPLSRDDLPRPPKPGQTPRLVSIGHFEGVAAVAPGQELRFAPRGLTIVYGPSGAGKTSYERVIKRLCRAVGPERRLLGNVFAADGDQPRQTAKVELERGGNLAASQVDLREPPPADLGSISVFDAASADVYVLEENTVAYVPSALTLLTRMATAQERMRDELQHRIADIEASRPKFPEFDEPSSARNVVVALSAETDTAAIDALAAVNEDDQRRGRELEEALALAGTRTAKDSAAAAYRLADEADRLRSNLLSATTASSRDRVSELHNLQEATISADAAVKLAVEQFSGEVLPGLGSEPWQQLWQAAHAFWHAATGTSFPPEQKDAACPLCLRTLDDETNARFRRFEEYVTSTVEASARAAHNCLDAAIQRLDPGLTEDCRGPFLESLRDLDSDLHAAVESRLSSAESRLLALRARAEGNEHDLEPLAPDVDDQLRLFAAARRSHAETLTQAADPAQEAKLRTELNDLKSRMLLSHRRDEVVSFVAALRASEVMRHAHSALHTRKITEKQKELTKQLVTDALRGKLRAELDALDFEHIEVVVDPRGTRGQTRLRLRLSDAVNQCALDEVLSIGERRAVALAFFLAEVAVAEHDGGIVLDDPVSSLDGERRTHLAHRLCEEAARRQVIIFTHDIAFMLELIAEADKRGVERAERGIWRIGDAVGRVDDHAPFETLPVKDRLAHLTSRAEHWTKPEDFASFDEAWRATCDFYRDLRKSWERAIEEVLFHKVVERFSPEVQTLRLRDVEVRRDHYDQIEAGMSRCSKFQHDSPVPSEPKLPRRKDLAHDLEVLRDFIKRVERERKPAKKTSNGKPDGAVQVQNRQGPA